MVSLFIAIFSIAIPLPGLFSAYQAPITEADTTKSNELDQVQWCREGILDASARPEGRQRWASRLVLLGTPNSKAAVAELLGRKDTPEAQRALADALAEHARTDRLLLDNSFTQPLSELLGHSNPELRSAAARAMAEFPDPEIPKRMGALIADPQTPTIKRLAAIEALAPNVHRREVVEQLIAILDLNLPEATTRAMAVLQPISRNPCGQDRACWKAWWSTQSAMEESARLTDQLQMYRDRALVAQRDLESLRESTKRHDAALAARVIELLRNDYRQLPVEQRDAKIVEWLKDPLPEVALGAIEIVKSRLADEGQRPEALVRDALLQLLKEGAPDVRREALQIVQNLNDPDVIHALLSRMESEDDPASRAGLFRALGKLSAIDAISYSIREISAQGSTSECRREAAIALGLIAAKPEAKPLLSASIEPLKSRYYSTSFDDVPLKSALLSAMAGVADETFRTIFLDALESNDPAILRPAIRGIRALADVSKLPRLRALTSDKDPLVRRSATEAISQLAREDVDFETLVPRLNPDIETNETVRQAAWTGFVEWQRRKPVADRIKASERLRDMPELELRYLVEVANDLEVKEGDRADVMALHDRLAGTFVSQGKYAAAVPHFKELYGFEMANNRDTALDTGLRWLDALLRSSNPGELSELLNKLINDAKAVDARNRIVSSVSDYVSNLDHTADPDRTRKLLTELRLIPTEGLDSSWSQTIDVLASKVSKNGNGQSRSGSH